MNVKIKISQTDIDKLMRTIVIIYDSNEQENSEILQGFDNMKVKYIKRKLKFGDYSCYIPKNEELGLPFDVSLENQVAIELKHSGKSGLTEVAGNITNGRVAFENEFIKAKESNCKMYLLISNGSWHDIRNGNYRTELGEKAFYNTLISWRKKYNFDIDFVREEEIPLHICRLLATNVKKVLEE